jgi:hypothetical protein
MLLAQLQQAGNPRFEHASSTGQANGRQRSTEANSAAPESSTQVLCKPHDKSSKLCADVS